MGFYPIPVRILPWLRHVLSSSDFWAHVELSVSSFWAEEPAASANSSGKERGMGCGHPAWLLVLWSMKCNHHYLIALLSPLGAVPSTPASWLGNHCLQNSSCRFRIQLECLTWWPFVIGNSSGWLCEQVFPFIHSKFTGNYWLTPLLLR